MHAVAYNVPSNSSNESLSGNLSDVWNGGYFWRDLFKRGVDNRLLLVHAVDRLTTVALQMAERRTALNDLAGYYAHITGDEIPQDQRQRLNAWVSAGYDLQDSSIKSEQELRLQRDRERPIEDRQDIPIGNNPCAINGRRKGSMLIASGADYE
ncbi:hypothetical protein PAECIP111892_01782 [Paenibacillus auburnensis]|uniref:Uncharacterized protein n=1 Tax=Paenibacillus auburnensis TaxID=2905649 RepID=A0ABN8G4S9_9BACL|nr:hypothetical protein [Paenibacillus auburnensis]CAH1194645.1 hypothetical protein PAECIP111892_01782 [Paenibacillus auburnensis]